jgi:hypothetical protein
LASASRAFAPTMGASRPATLQPHRSEQTAESGTADAGDPKAREQLLGVRRDVPRRGGE